MFELTLAVRYLVSARLQSLLLASGVSVGVVVFTFIAALMNGLSVRLTNDITGNVAHVTLQPKSRMPQQFMAPTHGRALFVTQPGREVKPVIRAFRSVLDISAQLSGVRAAVPEVFGNATLSRGDKDVAVAVTGVESRNLETIAELGPAMVRGALDVAVGNVVVGSRLAAELGVEIGDRVNLDALRSGGANLAKTRAIVVVRGIFTLGVQAIDERAVYIELNSAQKLFDMPDGVSVIELKLNNVWEAPELAERLARATDLKGSNWLDRNTRLQEGLRAQASTSTMIKAFSLLTIAIGVASSLYLAVSRRRAEIGILRSFGIGRAAILRAFVLQGFLIGTVGAVVGAASGFGFAELLLLVSQRATGAPAIPIDPGQGEYLRAMLLAIGASALAALLPAWAASRLDPLMAIQS